jgi:hypothetical protein
MLVVQANILSQTKIFCIRSSGVIGAVIDFWIDPRNLKVSLLKISLNDGSEKVLDVKFIRDWNTKLKLIAINDFEILDDIQDLIGRQKELVEYNFRLRGCKVKNVINKKAIGYVVDYNLEASSLYIYNLIITKGTLLAKIGIGPSSIINRKFIKAAKKDTILIIDDSADTKGSESNINIKVDSKKKNPKLVTVKELKS